MSTSKNLSAVDSLREHKHKQILPCLPICSSRKAGWNGIYLEYHRQPSWDIPETYCTWHAISINTKAPSTIQIEQTLNGCFQSELVREGNVTVIPASINSKINWDGELEFILLGLEPTIFSYIAYDLVDPDRVELVPQLSKPDPLIYQIGIRLKAVLESAEAESRLYAETMAEALAVHLLLHYSVRLPKLRDYAGGLSKQQLRKVINYINDHLDQSLSLTELASVALMSVHYFSHLFKQSMGMTPYQYVIHCRVKRAKELIIRGELTLSEVASKTGFSSQSHLNRHFKRLTGVTPKRFLQK